MSVRDRYLVGKLAPRTPGDATTARRGRACSGGRRRWTTRRGERRPRSTSPAPSSTARAGRVEPEDDALDEIDTTNNQSLVPSSMGLTFCVGARREDAGRRRAMGQLRACSERGARVHASRGRTARPARSKRRRSRSGAASRAAGASRLHARRTAHQATRARRATRTRFASRARCARTPRASASSRCSSSTVSWSPRRTSDSAWLFQPELIVKGSGEAAGTPVFLRRPSNDVVVDDAERDPSGSSIGAAWSSPSGHGVAVHAETRAGRPDARHRRSAPRSSRASRCPSPRRRASIPTTAPR